MSSWFRMYESVLDDPKVQRIPAEAFKGWVNLLCLAKRHNGALPALADIAFALRLSDKDAAKLVDVLVSSGLIDRNGTSLAPHNWNGRQYQGDVSTERVKRFRQRSAKQHETVSETASATPPETETETETEQSRTEAKRGADAPAAPTPPAPVAAPAEPDDPDDLLPITLDRTDCGQAVRAYNALADRAGLPQVQKLTAARRRALRSRLTDCGGLPGWSAALDKLAASSFCRGKNDRGWVADFDFLTRESSFVKLMEGKYDDRDGSPNGPFNNGFAELAASGGM